MEETEGSLWPAANENLRQALYFANNRVSELRIALLLVYHQAGQQLHCSYGRPWAKDALQLEPQNAAEKCVVFCVTKICS